MTFRLVCSICSRFLSSGKRLTDGPAGDVPPISTQCSGFGEVLSSERRGTEKSRSGGTQRTSGTAQVFSFLFRNTAFVRNEFGPGPGPPRRKAGFLPERSNERFP